MEQLLGNPLGSTFANRFFGMIEKKIFNQHLLFYPGLRTRSIFISSLSSSSSAACFTSSSSTFSFLPVRVRVRVP